MADHRTEHVASREDPQRYWAEQARLVDWIKKPQRVLDDDHPTAHRWFPDATLNTCYNALDRHVVHGHADRPALIHDSPVAGASTFLTFAQLLERTAAFAGALRALGVQPGDRMVIQLPVIPEAVIAMLACARIGAVHSPAPGDLGPRELAARIDDIRPRVVVTASCGSDRSRLAEYKPVVDRALQLADHQPDAVVVKQRPQAIAEMHEPRDVDWDLAIRAGSTEPAACVPVSATDPLYVLPASETTDAPEGVVVDNGGHAVAMAWSMPTVYDVHPGQVWWTACDLGSVVGHSGIVYGPLLAGATTVLHEGHPVGTPDAGTFWRVAGTHRVEALLTTPEAIRAIRRADPDGRLAGGHDLSMLRSLFLVGEGLDPDTSRWADETLGLQVADDRWQSESGLSDRRSVEQRPGPPGWVGR